MCVYIVYIYKHINIFNLQPTFKKENLKHPICKEIGYNKYIKGAKVITEKNFYNNNFNFTLKTFKKSYIHFGFTAIELGHKFVFNLQKIFCE